MNKKYNCKLILYILIIFIFTIYINSVSAESETTNEATGFTVASINSVHIISNNKDLSKANFTLTLIANGGGQSVVGNFGNETFTNILTNLVIKYPLKIEIGNIKEILTYPILNQGMLFKYETHYIEPKSFWEGAKCDGSTYCFPINIPMSIQLVGPDKILAINRIPSEMYGALGNPDVSWNGKMTLTINGVPITKDIGSNSAGSVNFNGVTGEFVANAKWGGSLVTGQSTPNQNLYLPTYSQNKELWQIAPKTYYDTYTKSLDETDIALNTWKAAGYGYHKYNSNNVQIFVNTCDDSICSKVMNYINVHNENLKILTNANEKIGYESVLSTTSTISTKKDQYPVGGSVTDIIDRKIGNPVIIMIVKASTLQPYIQTGIPKIESITSETFNSGDGKGAAYVKVKNIGDAQGTFAAYLTEESGTFIGQSNVESAKITLDPQQSGTIKININYGTNLQNITKTGAIIVYDVNYPDEKTTTTKEFTINMNSPKLCKPDDYRIFSGEVYKCSTDGTSETKVLDCDTTINLIKFVDDVPICEVINKNTDTNSYDETEQTEKSETVTEKEKDNNDSALLIALYWLSAFLILAIIFTFVNKIRNNEEKITKKNMDNSIILSGIIIGLLYLYLQYVALESTLGLMLWTIIAIVIIIVAILNIISYFIHEKLLSIKLSAIIAIGLFIIITAIATGLKDIMCDNWATKWMFSNCEKFNLTDYIFGKNKE